MAGLIYDSSEASRLQETLNKQETELSGIDKEKSVANSKILRYSIIIAGSVILLVVLKVLISKKKK